MDDKPDLNVVPFPGSTTADIPPQSVLDGASAADLESVVILGWDKESNLYFASSNGYSPDVLWLLKAAEKELLSDGDAE